jgi:hypothetical protein
MHTESGGRTALERLADRSTRGLGARLSRRSFMGRLGRGVVAVSLGSAGVELVRSPAASAAACPPGCDCSCSIVCAKLPGWTTNACPPNSCACGHWIFFDNSCSSGLRKFHDCCGTGWCADHGGCKCVTFENRPTCCNNRAYSNGSCFPSPGTVVCRYHECVSSGTGEQNYCT